MEWSNDPNGETIYWLKGMAGTRKSTVSRTVGHSFSKEKLLGASFLFSRNQVDLHHANKLITTFARELATTVPSLKRDISRAIAANNSRILQQRFREQWKHLILGPLDRLGDSEAFQPQSLIFVIDAVDECESANDIGLILKTLSETKPLKGIRLRVFITSRLEVSGNVEAARIFVLLPDLKSIDIEIFIKYELQKIRKTREFELPDAWPGVEKIDLLVQRAEGLFIYAATACLFIGDKRFDPMKRLPLLNMCNLKVPGFLANEVEKIRLEKNFPPHFLYACRLWVDHLERGYVDFCDDDNICGFLQKHFLNWLEALSLIGSITAGVIAIRKLASIIVSYGPHDLVKTHREK